MVACNCKCQDWEGLKILTVWLNAKTTVSYHQANTSFAGRQCQKTEKSCRYLYAIDLSKADWPKRKSSFNPNISSISRLAALRRKSRGETITVRENYLNSQKLVAFSNNNDGRSAERSESYDCDCVCGCCLGRRLCHSLPGGRHSQDLFLWYNMRKEIILTWIFGTKSQVYKKTCSSRHIRKEEKNFSSQEKCWSADKPDCIWTFVKMSELIDFNWIEFESRFILDWNSFEAELTL